MKLLFVNSRRSSKPEVEQQQEQEPETAATATATTAAAGPRVQMSAGVFGQRKQVRYDSIHRPQLDQPAVHNRVQGKPWRRIPHQAQFLQVEVRGHQL